MHTSRDINLKNLYTSASHVCIKRSAAVLYSETSSKHSFSYIPVVSAQYIFNRSSLFTHIMHLFIAIPAKEHYRADFHL